MKRPFSKIKRCQPRAKKRPALELAISTSNEQSLEIKADGKPSAGSESVPFPTEMPPYIFRPLASERNIRLCGIWGAEDDSEPLRATIRVASLDDPDPYYYAVSYAWETETATVPIDCEGAVLYITPNLENALRQFRPPDSTYGGVFWIDSVCS